MKKITGIFIFLLFTFVCSAQKLDDFAYILNHSEKTATILYYRGNSEKIVFPSEIEGYKVTAIGRRHSDYVISTLPKNAKDIYIPETVNEIILTTYVSQVNEIGNKLEPGKIAKVGKEQEIEKEDFKLYFK